MQDMTQGNERSVSEMQSGQATDSVSTEQTQDQKPENGSCECDGTTGADAECGCGKAEAQADGAAKDNTASTDEQTAVIKADYEAQIAKLTDQLKRSMAEFDNYRKRTEQEKLSMFDRGVTSVAEKILPTIDNFERAMASEPKSEEARAFVSGMEMVYKSFVKTLEDIGIKPIECVGREFDPNLHHAVMHEDDDSGEQNIITEELQKGYMLKDKVIRCSMVKVKN